MVKKKANKVANAADEQTNAIDSMLIQMTSGVDYYRMCYLVCFLLFIISGLMCYSNFEDLKLRYLMGAQMFLALGLGVLVCWFE